MVSLRHTSARVAISGCRASAYSSTTNEIAIVEVASEAVAIMAATLSASALKRHSSSWTSGWGRAQPLRLARRHSGLQGQGLAPGVHSSRRHQAREPRHVVSAAFIEIPDKIVPADVAYPLVYATLALTGLSFVGTFVVAPKFKSEFKVRRRPPLHTQIALSTSIAR